LALRLFDLSDQCEDGRIESEDYACSSEYIENLFDETPPEGTELSSINVTEALWYDLFQGGTGDVTTGFILIPSRNYSTGCSSVHLGYVNPHITINIKGTPMNTPTPSSTPKPTNTPYKIECEIDMPSDTYYPGDIVWTDLWITNYTSDVFWDTPVFVILDVYGTYYFAPSFMDFDYYVRNVIPGEILIIVLGEFYWPEGAGEACDIRWWAAATDPEMTKLISTMEEFSFSWYE